MMRVLWAVVFAGLWPIQAHAADVLAYGTAFGAVRNCTPGDCGLTVLEQDFIGDYDINPTINVEVSGRGSAAGAALPGLAAFDLPLLQARGSVTSNAHSVAFVTAFQGYRNTGSVPIPISFSGALEWTRTPALAGFVTAGLAILNDSIIDPDIGVAWLGTTNNGEFTATCATPGAIAVVGSGLLGGNGAQSTSLNTASGMCNGESLYTVAPGEQFYVHARLLAFSANFTASSTDASNTFVVNFSDETPSSSLALIEQFLVTVPLSVPESSTWIMLIAGFGITGGALRRRRAVNGHVARKLFV